MENKSKEINFSKQELIDILINKWDYKEKQVEGIVERIIKMHPSILSEFVNYLETEQFSDTPVFYGCSPIKLHETYVSFKPPAVFLLLEWISKDPKEAFIALKEEFGKLPD